MHKSCQCVWFCYLNQCKTKFKENDSWLALMRSVMCWTACVVKEEDSHMWQPLKPSTVHLLEHVELSAEPAKQTLHFLTCFIFTAEGGWYCQQTWGKLARGCCSGAGDEQLLFPQFSPILSWWGVSEQAAMWCLAARWVNHCKGEGLVFFFFEDGIKS